MFLSGACLAVTIFKLKYQKCFMIVELDFSDWGASMH